MFHNLEENVRLCAPYIPPISSSYHDKDVFNELALDIIDFSSARNPTILMGDFNARTGELLGQGNC